MPEGIGYSFDPAQPFNGNGGANGGNGGGRSRLSPQQAVRILSLRVPESLPSNAPVNRALLTSPGGSAAGASGLNSMIQQLIEAFKPTQAAPQGVPALPPVDLTRPASGSPAPQGPVSTVPGPSGQPRPTPTPVPQPNVPPPTPAAPPPPSAGTPPSVTFEPGPAPAPTTGTPGVGTRDISVAPPAMPVRRPRGAGGFFDMEAPPLF